MILKINYSKSNSVQYKITNYLNSRIFDSTQDQNRIRLIKRNVVNFFTAFLHRQNYTTTWRKVASRCPMIDEVSHRRNRCSDTLSIGKSTVEKYHRLSFERSHFICKARIIIFYVYMRRAIWHARYANANHFSAKLSREIARCYGF